MFKWLRDLHTEVDNQTIDHAKVLMTSSTVSAIGIQGWAVFHNHVAPDMMAFGGGMAALFAGFSALAKLKKESNIPFVDPPADVSVDVK